jgi:hypothetical protein
MVNESKRRAAEYAMAVNDTAARMTKLQEELAATHHEHEIKLQGEEHELENALGDLELACDATALAEQKVEEQYYQTWELKREGCKYKQQLLLCNEEWRRDYEVLQRERDGYNVSHQKFRAELTRELIAQYLQVNTLREKYEAKRVEVLDH